MRKKIAIAALVLVVVSVGAVVLCATGLSAGPRTRATIPSEARAILEDAESFELLAIVCERGPEPGEASVPGGPFKGYPITKTVAIPPGGRGEVIRALYRSIELAGDTAKCFEPHHAIRVKRGDQVATLLICFKCRRIEIEGPGALSGYGYLDTSAQPLFEQLLR